MPVPAGLQFTPLCGAALPQEGADLYHPRLTMSELMSDEESKNTLQAAWKCPPCTYPQPLHLGEALGAGLAPPGSRSPPKPAMSHPALWGHQPSRNYPSCGAVPQTLLGLPSACPCSHLGTVTVVALAPLPVFTQEQV